KDTKGQQRIFSYKLIVTRSLSIALDYHVDEKDLDDYIKVSSDREVHKVVNDYFNKKQSIKFVEITLSELKEAINKAKDQSAMGFDGIHNKMLKNLPNPFLIRVLELQLFNKTISYSKTNKFLGLYFDESLCFDKQIKELNHNTLASLYKALIGSILDYNFPCLNSFSESGLQKVQVIQNTAVRCILKLPLRTSSES
ncbi:hypothetical protein BpHYR1_043546, partial [Brachionus plicatilis]